MNYEGLERAYWTQQTERVVALREKINALSTPTAGHAVPGENDLVIGAGRRLNMAIMFLDISEFSQRPSETADEQDMLRRVLSLFFSEMIKIAEDYGGTVEKNTGDGLMAYFEDAGGTPPENGVKRAVASSLTMMAANTHLIRPVLLATPVPELQFRIAIDYGQVTIARLGAPRRFNANVAIGATANFASKMLSKARPGDVVLGASAREQLPLNWQLSYTELATTDTGWVYRTTGASYPLYRYTGRWANLL